MGRRAVKPPLELVVCLGFRDWIMEHLRWCLQSLSVAVPFPVVLVDLGASPDVATLAAPHAGVHLVPRRANGWSRSMALNLAAGSAFFQSRSLDVPADWYVFTDADMIFPHGWVEAVTARLSPQRLLLTPSRDLPAQVPMTDALLRDAEALRWHSTAHPRWGMGGAMVVPTDWFHRVGGFDETYRTWGGEDADLVLRAAWDGLEVRWLQDTFVAHQAHRRDWPTGPEVLQIRANQRYLAQRVRERGPIKRNAGESLDHGDGIADTDSQRIACSALRRLGLA